MQFINKYMYSAEFEQYKMYHAAVHMVSVVGNFKNLICKTVISDKWYIPVL
jgi:hypothetical protein